MKNNLGMRKDKDTVLKDWCVTDMSQGSECTVVEAVFA